MTNLLRVVLFLCLPVALKDGDQLGTVVGGSGSAQTSGPVPSELVVPLVVQDQQAAELVDEERGMASGMINGSRS